MKIHAVILATLLLGIGTTLAAETDTPAANMAIIRAQHELLNRGDWQATLGYYTAESRNFGQPVGRSVMTRIFQDIYRTFPDYREDILDITAVGDSVILRVVASGTHKGIGTIPVNGGMLVDVAPTNRHFEAKAIHWYTLKGGKIADHFAVRDDLAMMQQLGLAANPKPFDWQKFAAETNEN